MDWTPDAWKAAVDAMRERSSATVILALYEAGGVTLCEMLAAAWEQCHDKPALRAELVRQFRSCPDEDVVRTVGGGLEELAAQVRERARLQKSCKKNAEPL
jgi:hypothetical protein